MNSFLIPKISSFFFIIIQGDSSRNPRNFKGTLYKRGQGLRRRYKPRWFVLDAERNHLTYYDSEADTQLQGYIDLGELRACRPMPVPQGAAKVGDARSYFEVINREIPY